MDFIVREIWRAENRLQEHSTKVQIPDTLIVSAVGTKSPLTRPVLEWYFTSERNGGRLLRKKSENTTRNNILKVFEISESDSRHKAIASKSEISQETIELEHLQWAELADFLQKIEQQNHEENRIIVQKYVYENTLLSKREHAYTVTYTRGVGTKVEKIENICQITANKGTQDIAYKSLITYEDLEADAEGIGEVFSERVPLSAHHESELLECCEAVIACVELLNSKRHGKIASITLHFRKFGNVYYLLNCSKLKFAGEGALPRLWRLSFSYTVQVAWEVRLRRKDDSNQNNKALLEQTVVSCCQACYVPLAENDVLLQITQERLAQLKTRLAIEQLPSRTQARHQESQQQPQHQYDLVRICARCNTEYEEMCMSEAVLVLPKNSKPPIARSKSGMRNTKATAIQRPVTAYLAASKGAHLLKICTISNTLQVEENSVSTAEESSECARRSASQRSRGNTVAEPRIESSIIHKPPLQETILNTESSEEEIRQFQRKGVSESFEICKKRACSILDRTDLTAGEEDKENECVFSSSFNKNYPYQQNSNKYLDSSIVNYTEQAYESGRVSSPRNREFRREFLL